MTAEEEDTLMLIFSGTLVKLSLVSAYGFTDGEHALETNPKVVTMYYCLQRWWGNYYSEFPL